MSEFSESYHLKTENADDAIQLLRDAELKGYVYQPVNGWVTFLAEGGDFEPIKNLVSSAKSPLLHYVSCEDHGWSFTLFDRSQIVSRYRCDWNDEIEVEDSQYSREVLLKIIPTAQAALLDNFEGKMNPDDFNQIFETEPSKLFAQALGLEHYDWLSYDYMARDFQDSPEDYSEVIEVN